jgi:hypothetical protein
LPVRSTININAVALPLLLCHCCCFVATDNSAVVLRVTIADQRQQRRLGRELRRLGAFNAAPREQVDPVVAEGQNPVEDLEDQAANMALPIDVAALNAMIQAAIAADRAANPPVAPAAVVVAPAPVLTPFSLTPAAVGAVPWDLQSSQGTKHYISATEAILPLYDGDHGKLNEFLRKISNRAEQFGFASILMVPDNDGINRDITREFGCVTMNNMRAKALLYQGLEVRDYQAAEMLRMLVSSSIDAAVVDQLHYRSSNYTVNIAAAGNPPVMKQDGPCMLHDLIAMVSVKTKATILQLTTQLYTRFRSLHCHQDVLAHREIQRLGGQGGAQ